MLRKSVELNRPVSPWPPHPREPTHHWRRCGTTLQWPTQRERQDVSGAGRLGSLCPGLPQVLHSCPLPRPTPPRLASTGADLDEAIVLNEDGVAGQVPVDDGGTAGVQKTASIEDERQEEPGQRAPERCRAGGKRVGKARPSPECRQDLRTPALPGLAADARLRRVGTKRLLSLRSPPATPLLNRGLSESPAPLLSLSSVGLPLVPSPLPIPGRSWPCGSSWSF